MLVRDFIRTIQTKLKIDDREFPNANSSLAAAEFTSVVNRYVYKIVNQVVAFDAQGRHFEIVGPLVNCKDSSEDYLAREFSLPKRVVGDFIYSVGFFDSVEQRWIQLRKDPNPFFHTDEKDLISKQLGYSYALYGNKIFLLLGRSLTADDRLRFTYPKYPTRLDEKVFDTSAKGVDFDTAYLSDQFADGNVFPEDYEDYLIECIVVHLFGALKNQRDYTDGEKQFALLDMRQAKEDLFEFLGARSPEDLEFEVEDAPVT